MGLSVLQNSWLVWWIYGKDWNWLNFKFFFRLPPWSRPLLGLLLIEKGKSTISFAKRISTTTLSFRNLVSTSATTSWRYNFHLITYLYTNITVKVQLSYSERATEIELNRSLRFDNWFDTFNDKSKRNIAPNFCALLKIYELFHKFLN